VLGALKGAGRGVVELNYRPAHGVVLSAEALARVARRERGGAAAAHKPEGC
jgi:hypothetical protein